MKLVLYLFLTLLLNIMLQYTFVNSIEYNLYLKLINLYESDSNDKIKNTIIEVAKNENAMCDYPDGYVFDDYYLDNICLFENIKDLKSANTQISNILLNNINIDVYKTKIRTKSLFDKDTQDNLIYGISYTYNSEDKVTEK